MDLGASARRPSPKRAGRHTRHCNAPPAPSAQRPLRRATGKVACGQARGGWGADTAPGRASAGPALAPPPPLAAARHGSAACRCRPSSQLLSKPPLHLQPSHLQASCEEFVGGVPCMAAPPQRQRQPRGPPTRFCGTANCRCPRRSRSRLAIPNRWSRLRAVLEMKCKEGSTISSSLGAHSLVLKCCSWLRAERVSRWCPCGPLPLRRAARAGTQMGEQSAAAG